MDFFNINEQFEPIKKLLSTQNFTFFKRVKNNRTTINDKLKQKKYKKTEKK